MTEEATVKIKMPQPTKTGLKVCALNDIHQAYGETHVYRGMNFEAERGDRVVLVGPNGAGKSTLLKILAGEIEFQQGEMKLGLNVEVGYFAQYRTLMLKGSRSVLEEALDVPDRKATEQEVRTLLGCFLFRGDDVYKSVSVLSGGEKSRLALTKILLNPPNLLLMDEPTTHLDMTSIDALTNALKQFPGTLIFISHDVYFIRSIAEKVIRIDAGELTSYAGDYDYYLEKSGRDFRASGTHCGATIASCRDQSGQAKNRFWQRTKIERTKTPRSRRAASESQSAQANAGEARQGRSARCDSRSPAEGNRRAVG